MITASAASSGEHHDRPERSRRGGGRAQPDRARRILKEISAEVRLGKGLGVVIKLQKSVPERGEIGFRRLEDPARCAAALIAIGDKILERPALASLSHDEIVEARDRDRRDDRPKDDRPRFASRFDRRPREPVSGVVLSSCAPELWWTFTLPGSPSLDPRPRDLPARISLPVMPLRPGAVEPFASRIR